MGPVALVDTAGIDDEGELGSQRVGKTIEAIKTLDVALLVVSENQFGAEEEEIIRLLREYAVPYVIAHNKEDITPLSDAVRQRLQALQVPVVPCSAEKHTGIREVVDALVAVTPATAHQPDQLVGDLVARGSRVVLVMPQDDEAPEGRLILPQVQVIRDLLDHHAVAIVVQPEELAPMLESFRPDLVITDSQVFGEVSKIVPAQIPLTSFSLIMARAKGDFKTFLQSTPQIANLRDGDRVLMLESCTHATACGDIGREKIPALLQKVTGKKLQFDFVAALDPLPESLQDYAMAIQCGGCMVTKKQLLNRVRQLVDKQIPVSNYGMTIAYLTGIFDRVTAPFIAHEDL